MGKNTHFDFVVIGSGPAGQKAAIQAAKGGASVAIIERTRAMGGECVRRGTIPSKTLRECAARLTALRRQAGFFDLAIEPGRELDSLITGVDDIVGNHVGYMTAQLERNGIDCVHGRAAFVDAHTVEVTRISGAARRLTADHIIIATGSRPRRPPEIAIDHETVLDSDSILSLAYLPRSLVVLGAGVIACEYASVFQALGVEVEMVNRGDLPMGFLDPEISAAFLSEFEASGGTYHGHTEAEGVTFDDVSMVTVRLMDGRELRADKVLVALGRVANLEGLNIKAVGLRTTRRGQLEVDEFYRTNAPHIYAVGDVIGFPALATTSMEQGRRAVRHALCLDLGSDISLIPVGIYTLPEMSGVGLTEAEAIKRHGGCTVGRARFDEIARGLINGAQRGLLKLIADPDGDKLLGAWIVGDGATELVHVAQMAMLGDMSVDTFVDHVFNFPTLAEAYRVAALDLIGRAATARAEPPVAKRAAS